jgi:hypothetical protein
MIRLGSANKGSRWMAGWLRSRRRRIHCLILNYRVTGGYKEITAACSEHGTSSMFPAQTKENNGGRLLIGIVQVQFELGDAALHLLSISWRCFPDRADDIIESPFG